jgi:hypothetical protein
VKEKESDKYLGEMFHWDGLSRSVEETIISRVGKIKAVSWEIKAIVEDYRAEVVGGAMDNVCPTFPIIFLFNMAGNHPRGHRNS